MTHDFPYRTYTDQNLLDEFEKLKRWVPRGPRVPDALSQGRVGYKCSNVFFQYERMNTPAHRRPPSVDYWNRHHEYVASYVAKSGHHLFNGVEFLNHAPSQFSACVARQAYQRFGATHVFDPFAGWGDRCLAAMSMGIDYTGVDTNVNLHQPYERMTSFYPSSSNVTMLFQSAETVDINSIDFDFVLTSPPFWDRGVCSEMYENMPVTDYKQFMDTVCIPVLEACLEKASYVCLYIPDDMAGILREHTTARCDSILSFGRHGNKTKQEKRIYCYSR